MIAFEVLRKGGKRFGPFEVTSAPRRFLAPTDVGLVHHAVAQREVGRGKEQGVGKVRRVQRSNGDRGGAVGRSRLVMVLNLSRA